MEELDYITHWQEQIDRSNNQTNYRFIGDLVSDLRIEDQFSCSSEHQSRIYQFHRTQAQLTIHVLVDTRPPQQRVLIDPIEENQADEDDDRASRDHRVIQIREPYGLDQLCVLFAHTVLGILHQMVGLLLGVIHPSLVEPSHEGPEQMPRVDQPNDGHQKGIEEEHHGFFLDHAVTLLVDVVECDVLDQEGHECCGEEQAQGVLESEGKFVFAACSMLLDICEDVQHEGKAEFVEEDDQQHGQDGRYQGFLLFCVGQFLVHSCFFSSRMLGLFNLLQGFLNSVPLGCQDRIENRSDSSDKKRSQHPPNNQPNHPLFLRKVDILPNDLLRLRCLIDLYMLALPPKELHQFLPVQPLKTLEEMILGVLALHDYNGLLALYLVLSYCLAQEGMLFLDLLAFLGVLLVQFSQSSGAVLALLLVHPFLFLFYYGRPLVFQLVEVLEFVEQNQLLYFELINLVLALSVLPHSDFHELSNPLIRAYLIGQVPYQNRVIAKRGGPFVIIIVGLSDHIPHVYESHQMYEERREPQNDLIPGHIQLRPHELQQPTRASPLIMIRQFPDSALLADIKRGLQGPTDGKGTICDNLKYEQDDGILHKDEIQRKPKAQKLQFFGGVLAQGDGFLMDDVQAALAEGVFGWWVIIYASGAGWAEVWGDGLAGAAGEAVVCCEGPIRADLVEVQHVMLKLYESPDQNQMYRCGTIKREMPSVTIHSLLVIFIMNTLLSTCIFHIFCHPPIKPAKPPFPASSFLPASLPENAHPAHLFRVRQVPIIISNMKPVSKAATLQLQILTWEKDSHGLFDYQATKHVKEYFEIQGPCKVFRNWYQAQTCLVANDKVKKGQIPDDTFTFLSSISLRHNGNSQSFLLYPPERPSQEILKKDGNAEELGPMNTNAYIVVKHYKGSHRCQGYPISLGNIVKLGRVEYRVVQIGGIAKKNDQKKQLFLGEFNGVHDANEVVQGNCKFCLCDDSTPDNFLISPCKCKGSCQGVHVQCLKQWIDSKVKKQVTGMVVSYNFTKFQCEICKEPFPRMVTRSSNNFSLEMITIDKPKIPYCILEGINQRKESKEERCLHVIAPENKNSVKIGRGHQCEIRLQDISVSRQHSEIKFQYGEFFVNDLNSKFGTLVRLDKVTELNSKIKLQIGRSLYKFQVQ